MVMQNGFKDVNNSGYNMTRTMNIELGVHNGKSIF